MSPPLQAASFGTPSGLTLQADVGGPPDGSPVVLLHGGGQTRHSWRRAARSLSERGHRVVSLDLRGHGSSDWAADGDYTIDAFEADLLAVLSQLGRPAAMVGASLGGATALMAAGRLQAPVTALVLVDVVPRLAEKGVGHIHSFMSAHPEGFASVDEAAEAVARYLPHRPRPPSAEGLMKNLRREADGRLYWHWDPAFLTSPRRLDRAAVVSRLEAAARQVRVPTLLVRGLSSDVVDDEGVEHLRCLVPHARVAGVEGAGHMVAGDRNDRFNQAVEAFLAETLG